MVPVEEGQEFSLRQLLAYMLIPSGNNIARLLARWTAGCEAAFVRRMNESAAELGMTRTRFTGSCGMDIGNTSTAGDLLVLARTVMRDEAFRTIVATPSVRLPGNRGEARTTNRLLGRHGVAGLKTGTSTPAGGNVLWAAYKEVDGSRRLVLGAVLAQRSGCSPVRARAAVWAHSRRLVEAVQRAPLDELAALGPSAQAAPPSPTRPNPGAGRGVGPGGAVALSGRGRAG